MAAAAVVPFVTIDEYLHMSFEHDADYVDGRIEERPVGELDHADLQSILVTLFRNHRKEWGIRAVTEYRVQVAPTRFRVPDVTVMDRSKPRTAILREAPMLCIEILSPEDRWSRMQLRLEDYFRMGVPTVWVFDPEFRSVHVLSAQAAPVEHHSGTLRLPNTPVEVSIDEVFALLDE